MTNIKKKNAHFHCLPGNWILKQCLWRPAKLVRIDSIQYWLFHTDVGKQLLSSTGGRSENDKIFLAGPLGTGFQN